MLNQRRLYSYLLLLIVSTNCLLLSYAYPQNEVYQRKLSQEMQQSPVYQSTAESTGRKYAVKPNASKKVALDDVEDDGDVVNQLSETPTGFSWSNMLSTVLTMFFNGAANAPSKSDDIDNSVGFGGSPWANVISMGEGNIEEAKIAFFKFTFDFSTIRSKNH
uniref:Uncharacterized protein n=1 Tax=Bactrocera latifrons TaxID=174628 RepID=A0A0K8WC11_BACLA